MSHRSKCLALLLAVGAAALPSAVGAEESRLGLSWMSGEAIRGSFSGKDLAGIYPNGNPWTERIFENGTTDYREGIKHWRGEWWVANREFCFFYPPPGLGGCFRVVRISPNCFELYDFSGERGRADEPPALAQLWNGRMWLQSQPTTCEERPLS